MSSWNAGRGPLGEGEGWQGLWSRERAGAASVRLQSDDGARKNISFKKVGMTN